MSDDDKKKPDSSTFYGDIRSGVGSFRSDPFRGMVLMYGCPPSPTVPDPDLPPTFPWIPDDRTAPTKPPLVPLDIFKPLVREETFDLRMREVMDELRTLRQAVDGLRRDLADALTVNSLILQADPRLKPLLKARTKKKGKHGKRKRVRKAKR